MYEDVLAEDGAHVREGALVIRRIGVVFVEMTCVRGLVATIHARGTMAGVLARQGTTFDINSIEQEMIPD